MKLTESLSSTERRLVLALCVAAACCLTLSTVFTYLLVPIQADFGASDAQMTSLRQAPSIAALLVVFPAGALGVRVGEKRFALWCSLTFALGSALVALAPGIEVATLGFLLANIGRAAMFIVGLGYMASLVEGKDSRAAAFALFSMILPIVYIVMPVVAGLLIDGAGWRWVAVICSLLGLVGTFLIQRFVPGRERHGPVGELWTPALAGAFIVLVVQSLGDVRTYGLTSTQVAGQALAALVTLAVLIIVMRTIRNPSLSLAPLRQGGFVLLLIALILFGFANLWFYTTMAFQYLYGLSSLQTALAMMPAQIASLGGAALAGRLIQKKGIPFAGTALIVAVAIFLWCSAIVGATSPVWLPIVIVSLYALAAVGAGVPITNAIMNTAPKGQEGAAASYRSAATNVGAAVSVAFMTGIVAAAVSVTARAQYVASGDQLSPSQSLAVAHALDAGQSASSVAQHYSVPVTTIEGLASLQAQALDNGYRAHGLAGGLITLLVGAAFWIITRRQERQGEAAHRGDPGKGS